MTAKSRLSKALDILKTIDLDVPKKDRPNTDELVTVKASCHLHDGEISESTVCTSDVPGDAISEVVIGLMHLIRRADVDPLSKEIKITFSRTAELG
jgi:hypothetical protein